MRERHSTRVPESPEAGPVRSTPYVVRPSAVPCPRSCVPESVVCTVYHLDLPSTMNLNTFTITHTQRSAHGFSRLPCALVSAYSVVGSAHLDKGVCAVTKISFGCGGWIETTSLDDYSTLQWSVAPLGWPSTHTI